MVAVGSSNAVDSMFNGKLSGTREQTVYTPEAMTKCIRDFIGGIGYDPCWAPGATTEPEDKTHIDWDVLFGDLTTFANKCYGEERAGAALDLFFCRIRAKDASKQAVKDRRDIVAWFSGRYAELSGHMQEWPPRTFCNPPYGDRGPHASLGSFQEFTEAFAATENSVIMLCPVRSHRKWWRQNVLFTSDAICYLDPLKFEGFPQSFPAPLCLAYRGDDPEGFKAAFSAFGDTDVRVKAEPGGWTLHVATESSDHYDGVGWWDHEPSEEEVWEYMHENMGCDVGYPADEAPMDYTYKGEVYSSYAYPTVVYVGPGE